MSFFLAMTLYTSLSFIVTVCPALSVLFSPPWKTMGCRFLCSWSVLYHRNPLPILRSMSSVLPIPVSLENQGHWTMLCPRTTLPSCILLSSASQPTLTHYFHPSNWSRLLPIIIIIIIFKRVSKGDRSNVLIYRAKPSTTQTKKSSVLSLVIWICQCSCMQTVLLFLPYEIQLNTTFWTTA